MKVKIVLLEILLLASCSHRNRPYMHDYIIVNNKCRTHNQMHLKIIQSSCDSVEYDLSKRNRVYLIRNGIVLDSIEISKQRSFKAKYYTEDLLTGERRSRKAWTLDLSMTFLPRETEEYVPKNQEDN